MVASIPSGNYCRNNVISQIASSRFPLGGLGTSGYGRYHGKFSFDNFTHVRGEMTSPLFPGSDLCLLKYHPNDGLKEQLVYFVLKILPEIPVLYLKQWAVLGILVLVWIFIPFPTVKEAIANGLAEALQALADWLRPN